jgi:hypothetical protein
MKEDPKKKEKFWEYVKYDIPTQMSGNEILIRSFQKGRYEIYLDSERLFLILKYEQIIGRTLFESEAKELVLELIAEEFAEGCTK